MVNKKPAATRAKAIKSDKEIRRLDAPKYRSFRASKRIKHPGGTLPSASRLLRNSIAHLKSHPRIFGGIILVYLVLTIILVKGLSSGIDVPEIKTALQDVFGGGAGQVATGFTIFGLLLDSSSSASSDVAGSYQTITLILVSLALIWALRQTHAKTKITVKESFYKSMHPLIPFITVLFIIGLQFIPFAIGGWLFSVVISTGLAITAVEQILWGILFFTMTLLTLYMVSSSIFALYIVTLPDMKPLQALRSARGLVQYRRWVLVRKVVFLPIALVILGALIMLPAILFLTPIAEWIFFALSMFALAVTHSYMYSLYRELL